MTNQSRVRLLEVDVTQLEQKQWEWRVCEGDVPVMVGFRRRERRREWRAITPCSFYFR
jgi:hypothetical protein